VKLDRVPPRILAALGLVTAAPAMDACIGACLDVGPVSESGETLPNPTSDSSTTAGSATATTGGATTAGTTGGTSTTGDSMGEASVGPCLQPPPDDTTGGSTGGTAGDSSGTGGSSSGGMAASEADDPTARVLGSGVLPADVAARLRRGPGRGQD